MCEFPRKSPLVRRLIGSGRRVKTTLERDRRKTLESQRERFMEIYLGAAR
jgi:hypothetical protein